MAEQTGTAIATSGIKVIGAGFGRTGTLSIKAALEELGFGPCYHMVEVLDHPEHVPFWEAAARGEKVDWREMFKGYQATTDWPGCTFYQDLMQVYPDAKVLLTVRDPETWYESVQSTISQAAGRTSTPFFRMVNKLVWEGTFNGNFADKQYVIEQFNQYIEEVKQYVPAERLLVYSVKEGWEPLCTFLGVEVPKDKPFPRLNERATALAELENRRQRMEG